MPLITINPVPEQLRQSHCCGLNHVFFCTEKCIIFILSDVFKTDVVLTFLTRVYTGIKMKSHQSVESSKHTGSSRGFYIWSSSPAGLILSEQYLSSNKHSNLSCSHRCSFVPQYFTE